MREDVEDPQTAERIRAVLVPEEFTRVDGIIDLVFSTTEDLQQDEPPSAESDDEPTSEQERTPPARFHQDCVQPIQRALDESLVRRSRATFSTPDDRLRVVCAVSKEYEYSDHTAYWYAFHPHQVEFLEAASDSFVAFGCGSPEQILLIPFKEFASWLDAMHRTEREHEKSYWHVRIHRHTDGSFRLRLRKGIHAPELTEYFLTDETT